MAKIYIENRAYEADPKRNLLDACLSLGFNLPYFCWHPALGSVGACRQCAVKQFRDEKDEKGKIVMACLTPVTEGARISIEDLETAAFRAGVIEGLMTNHPHDCPVCDEGGECHLQDMTVMTGHDYREYEFEKRTFHNQYLGPFVNQEMNRCIQCYRCVRYYNEYAGGKDFGAFSLRDQVFFGRHADGTLENEFSGNLVEICPTGVFTDKTLKRHYTRKWDLQMAPSVCVHCGLGCNTTVGERYGSVRRVLNRFNSEVNGYFLCDRGRFGYEFVNSERRIRKASAGANGNSGSLPRQEATARFADILRRSRGLIGIGSPRASLEANFALRTLVGAERFFAGISDDQSNLISTMLEILRSGPARSPSLHEIELSDAVFVLGEDVTNTAPRMAVSLRQSVRQQPIQSAEKHQIQAWHDHAVREFLQDEKGPLFIATPAATPLDDVATRCYRGAPDDVARLGFAVAHALDESAPAVPDLPQETVELAAAIAYALKSAKRPLVVSGPSLNSVAIIQAAANVARALCSRRLSGALAFTAPECNSFGLGLMGATHLSQASEAMRQGADTVIVLENDLYQRIPSKTTEELLNSAREVVVMDHLVHRTAERATLTLPAGTFAESEGTMVSSEGRAQRYFRVLPPEPEIQASWEWLRDAMAAAGRKEGAEWRNLDDVTAAMAAAIPELAPVVKAAPRAVFRMAGEKIAREPYRSSGRTAILVNISVHEPKPPDDPNSPLAFSMEGAQQQHPPAAATPFFWSPGWNSIQATNFYQQEIAGPLRGGDAGVRLIEPAAGEHHYFSQFPPAFVRRRDEWLLVPLYHIFGSEALSMAAPAVAELARHPYIAINADDAKRLQVAAGDEMSITLNGDLYHLPIVIKTELPSGVAGVPLGLTSLGGIDLPARGTLNPSEKLTHA